MNGLVKRFISHTKSVLYWIFIAFIVGLASGTVGAAFHFAIRFVTKVRGENPWLLYLLPLGGIFIVFIFSFSKEKLSTNTVLDCIRYQKDAPRGLTPLIFVGSVITHLFGGSVGKEGAALQMGCGVGTGIGKMFKMDDEALGVAMVCGMSGAFSAVFTTPVTATIFALEFISVGHIRYFQLLPCSISALCGYIITLLFGNTPLFYSTVLIPNIEILLLLKVGVLAVLTAGLSSVFCVSLHKTAMVMRAHLKNDYLRIIIGGASVIVLTLLFGTRDYNGAGMDIIASALSGNAKPWAFILKLVLTAITVGSGYKGGEIVPALFIGATFGAAFGALIGLDPSFAAALGLICMFCGIVNCPISSVFLGIELFGASGIVFFMLAVSISYIASGSFGLYGSQKLIYSKYGVGEINRYIKK